MEAYNTKKKKRQADEARPSKSTAVAANHAHSPPNSKTNKRFKAGSASQSSSEMERKRKNALLVIDVQNDFCNGSMKIAGANDIVPKINAVRNLFDHVVFSKDWHPPDHCSFKSDNDGQITKGSDQDHWPVHCVQDSEGADLHPDLEVKEGDVIVTKGENPLTESYSAFWDTEKAKTAMEKELHSRGITDVFVCGLATDYCVSLTAFDAVEAGFRTHFLPDLSRGTTPETIEERHKRMKELGIRSVSLEELESLLSKNMRQDKEALLDKGEGEEEEEINRQNGGQGGKEVKKCK